MSARLSTGAGIGVVVYVAALLWVHVKIRSKGHYLAADLVLVAGMASVSAAIVIAAWR